MDGARVIEFDPEKVRQNGPGAVRMLGRLANAIILQQKLGVEFDRSIKVEMGDAVALLVSCVLKEKDDASERTTAGQERDIGNGVRGNGTAPAVVQPQGRLPGMAGKKPTKAGKGLRGKRKPADPGKSAKGEE